MQLIFDNKYVRSYRFKTKKEFSFFFDHQHVTPKLILEEQGGEFWYCYVGHDSLNSNKLFAIGFDSDTSQEDLHFLYWPKSELIVLNNASEVFIINDAMKEVAKYNLIAPLIGLHITQSNTLLILGEITMKLILPNGEVLKEEWFDDLLDDYQIIKNQLHIEVKGIKRVIDLQ